MKTVGQNIPSELINAYKTVMCAEYTWNGVAFVRKRPPFKQKANRSKSSKKLVVSETWYWNGVAYVLRKTYNYV